MREENIMLVRTLVNFISLALFAIAVWRMGMAALGTDSALTSLRRPLAIRREQAPARTVKLGRIAHVEMIRPAIALPSRLKIDPWLYVQMRWQQWSYPIDLHRIDSSHSDNIPGDGSISSAAS